MECVKLLVVITGLLVILPEGAMGQFLCTYSGVTKYCCECCKNDCCKTKNKKVKTCPTPAPFASGDSDSSSNKHIPHIVGGLTGGLTVVALVVAICCCCTKKDPAIDDVAYPPSIQTHSNANKPLPANTVSTFHATGPPTARPGFLASSPWGNP